MYRWVFILVFVLLSVPVQAVSSENKMTLEEAIDTLGIKINKPDKNDTSPCAGLAFAVLNCEKYTCKRSHDTIAGYIVEHVIYGKTSGGYCKHTQSLPDGKTIECLYSPAMQVLIAKMTANKEELSEVEKVAVDKSFQNQCDIVVSETKMPEMAQ